MQNNWKKFKNKKGKTNLAITDIEMKDNKQMKNTQIIYNLIRTQTKTFNDTWKD